jgi:5-methylcytosine-specific restriction endonuclease McrA
MRMLPCAHRLVAERESYCWLETSRREGEEAALVFRALDGELPVKCTAELAAACPFRERSQGTAKALMVPCPHCQRRHREGSVSQQLCEAWSSAKEALAELRRELPEGRRYYPEGTTVPPYDEGTTPLVRRLIWPRLQSAVLRRDRYRCQDCGAEFGARRRKVFDQRLQRGKGGYRWESLEVHHIIARSSGGSDHPGNLKTLCPSCHRGYTVDQTAVRAARRRDREALLRALEEEGYESEDTDDPRD